MHALSFGDMLRFGGYGAYFSFGLTIIILVLMVIGYVRAAGGRGLKGWSWAVLVAGLLCALNASLGTLAGLIRIWSFAAAAGETPAHCEYLATGSYEVLFNVVWGLLGAFLAFFAWATAHLLGPHGRD